MEFSFAGSSDLVTQLTQGAPADVFASADTKNMDKARQAGLLAGAPVNFASNTLTIAVAPGNPKGIKTFQDLAKPGLNVVVCAPQVPCGSATQNVENKTGVTLTPVSEESSVTDVLNKITSGQADAGWSMSPIPRAPPTRFSRCRSPKRPARSTPTRSPPSPMPVIPLWQANSWIS